jgi:hypothetical protein
MPSPTPLSTDAATVCRRTDKSSISSAVARPGESSGLRSHRMVVVLIKLPLGLKATLRDERFPRCRRRARANDRQMTQRWTAAHCDHRDQGRSGLRSKPVDRPTIRPTPGTIPGAQSIYPTIVVIL